MALTTRSERPLDLPTLLALIGVAVFGGLAILAYSVKIAMFFCLGLLFLAAGWYAIRPEIERRPQLRHPPPQDLHR